MAKRPLTFPITKGILKLARQIDETAEPDYVTVEPGEECLPGCCFQNVSAMVRRHGGSMQHGWKMREQPLVFVEGEFHAVWRRRDGGLVDVTPRTDELTKILFLPDSRVVWQGEAVEPHRMMLHEQPCYCGSAMPFKICHGLAAD
jgi:SEC-C motif